MKRLLKVVSALLLLVAISVPARASAVEEPLQKDDLFQGTDQFSKGAKSVTEVNLDKKLLAMIDRFSTTTGTDEKQLNLAKRMDFIYVRSYEFEKPGQYRPDDVEAFRRRLEGSDWSHMVKERSKDEQNDVWVRTDSEGQFTELVVISAEASELNFVHLKGHMSMKELTEAGAKYGVPQTTEPKAPKGAK
jgi:hypothetical protein